MRVKRSLWETRMRAFPAPTLTIATGSSGRRLAFKEESANLVMALARSESTADNRFNTRTGKVVVMGRLGSVNLRGRPPRCGFVLGFMEVSMLISDHSLVAM